MCLPPRLTDELINSIETHGYVPGQILSIIQFRSSSLWSAGIITESAGPQSTAQATRCAVLFPKEGEQSHVLALHPTLPTEVVKAMLDAY